MVLYCGVYLTKAVIIGRSSGFSCTDGADHFSAIQVCRVLRCCLVLGRRHTDDVVEETCRRGGPETYDVVHKRDIYINMWLGG